MESEASIRDLNDSGCVQDETPNVNVEQLGYQPVELLDLSDDVLLCIFKFCTPNDLKALAFTNSRLARLALEWRLWTKVDARGQNHDKHRVYWLMKYALNERTTSLALSGYAKQAAGCADYSDRTLKKQNTKECQTTNSSAGPSTVDWTSAEVQQNTEHVGPSYILRDLKQAPTDAEGPPFSPRTSIQKSPTSPTTECPEPIVTVTRAIMEHINTQCNITSLNLEYCNINLLSTGLDVFPPKLKRLSLKGTRCYNQPRSHKNLLFKLPDHLPDLEYINLSECTWLGPSCLLALSKLIKLRELYLKKCPKMTDFLAYAALATRFGFPTLELIDFRGSPVGDSEVSSFSAVAPLRIMRCAAATKPSGTTHLHEETVFDWELEEPEYLKRMQLNTEIEAPNEDDDISIKHIKATDPDPCNYNVLLTAEDVIRSRQIFAGELLDNMVHMIPNNLARNLVPVNVGNEEGNEGAEANVNDERGNEGVEANGNEERGNDGVDTNGNDGDPKAGNRSVDGNEGGVEGNEGDVEIDKRNVQLGEVDMEAENVNTEAKNKNVNDNEVSKRDKNEAGNDGSDAPPPKKRRLDNDDENMPGTSKGVCVSSSENSTQSRDASNSRAGCSNASGDGKSRDNNNSRDRAEDSRDRGENSRDNGNRDAQNNQRNNNDPMLIRNQDNVPVYVRRCVYNEAEERENDERAREARAGRSFNYTIHRHLSSILNGNQNRLIRHPVIYVDYGDATRHRSVYAAPNPNNSLLVTDSAVFMYGQSSSENVNVIHLSLHNRHNNRPRAERSTLEELVMNGYSMVTDRSLVHLATAAPRLRLLDLRRTRVTAAGVANFKCLRPDCEVLFSEFNEKDE